MAISKHPGNPQKSQTKDARIYYLGRYILGLQMPDPAEKCIASLKLGFHFDTPELCIFEMQVVAKNAVKSPDPILHTIFSFPAEDTISSHIFEEIVIDYVDFFHLEGQQIIAGLHADTDNHHIHIMLNRCDFINDKVIEIEKGFTRYAGSRFSTFLENKYSLNPSEATASYFINDQIVLSDLYRLDSAQGRIRDWTAKFGKPSQASILSKIVRPIIEQSTTWTQYQQELYNRGIKLASAKFGGLIFITADAEGKEIPVACSRVFPGATQKKLNLKFEGQFDPDFTLDVPQALGNQMSVVGPVSSAGIQTSVGEGEAAVAYGRYSEAARGTVEETQQVREWLRGFGGMVPSAEVTFWKPVRSGPGTNRGRRVHMIDRARGDPSPLDIAELIMRAGNIAGLHRCGWNVDLRPTWANAIVVTGPTAVMQQLLERGVFPRVSQRDGDRSLFVFVDVPQQSVRGGPSPRDYLLQSISKLKSIDVQEDGVVRLARREPAELASLTIDPTPVPSPFLSLISPARAQVLGDLAEKIDRLTQVAKTLVENYVPRLAHLKFSSLLSSAFEKVKQTMEVPNDNRNRPLSVQPSGATAGEIDRKFGGVRPASERVDEKERRAHDGGGYERISGRTPQPVGVDPHGDEQVGGSRGGNHQDAGHGPRLHADLSKAHDAKRIRAEDYSGPASRYSDQPGDLAAGTAPAPNNAIATVEGDHPVRMLQSLLLAARHGFTCVWDNENGPEIRINGTDRNGTFSCLVRAEVIIVSYPRSDFVLSKSNAPDWLLALSDQIVIPVQYPPESVQPVPALTIDAPVSVQIEEAVQQVKPSFFHPKKNPRQLVCALEDGVELDLDQDQEVIRRFEDLQELDLSAVERVDFYVSDPILFTAEIFGEMRRVKEAVQSQSCEVPEIGLRSVETAAIAPTRLVFLFSEAADTIPEPPDPSVCLLLVDANGIVYNSPAIAYTSLEFVTLHDVDAVDRQLVRNIVTILMERFDLLDCKDRIEVEVSAGPLVSQSWMKPPPEDNDNDNDNDIGFGL